MPDAERIDRRQFTCRLAAGTGVVATVAAGAAVHSVTESAGQDRPPAPKLPEDPPARPAEPPPEVLLLTYLVRTRPSDKLDDAALQGVFRDIRGDVARGQALSEFELKNSDEPAFAFRPYRSSEGVPAD